VRSSGDDLQYRALERNLQVIHLIGLLLDTDLGEIETRTELTRFIASPAAKTAVLADDAGVTFSRRDEPGAGERADPLFALLPRAAEASIPIARPARST
jgi:hypothetical protein